MGKMLTIWVLIAVTILMFGASHASADWDVTFEGSCPAVTEGRSVQETTDGGFIVVGSVCLAEPDPPGVYVWLIKTDAYGNKQWDRTFGHIGPPYEMAYSQGNSVQQTSDGGYVIAGSMESMVSASALLIKTDADGNMEWERIFAGHAIVSDAKAYSVQQTDDGGYIITGYSDIASIGTDREIWLIKTDSHGKKQWDRTFSGPKQFDEDVGYSVRQTTDGGYIITGHTSSGCRHGSLRLIKTDASGNKQWDKKFGGEGDERGHGVKQTSDGGYIVCGYTTSYGSGWQDMWLIKTDSDGIKQWDKTFGGDRDDGASSVQQTSDGGYIVVGFTEYVYSIEGLENVWLVKTDADGNMLWGQTFGGPDFSGGMSLFSDNNVQQTSDGGYVIASAARSDPEFWALWLIKTDGSNCDYYYRDADSDAFGISGDMRCLGDAEYPYTAILEGDCDDSDPTVNPAAVEILCTEKDDDCNPATPDDENSDGDPVTFCGGDCDDGDPGIYPGNTEILCNGIDEDCSTATPDDPNADGDPVTFCEGDCDDTDPGIYPGNTEIFCNIIDDDCDPATPDDENSDGDAFSICEGDCDDSDPTVNPAATETMCNGKDDDCNLATPDDENVDGDPVSLCQGDCDDTDPGIYPGNTEIFCNGIDEDCTTATPDDPNADGDPVSFCQGDCDDTDPRRYPGNTELCDDGIDNDCDLLVDAEDMDCPGIKNISLFYPTHGTVAYLAPTFEWRVTGGMDNRFAVDFSIDPTFSRYWSTYENLGEQLTMTRWTPPLELWTSIPSGKNIYWRVRGVDLDLSPLKIRKSDETWAFQRY